MKPSGYNFVGVALTILTGTLVGTVLIGNIFLISALWHSDENFEHKRRLECSESTETPEQFRMCMGPKKDSKEKR